jgi:hypothetical protein
MATTGRRKNIATRHFTKIIKSRRLKKCKCKDATVRNTGIIKMTMMITTTQILVIKSRTMRWAGHVAHMGEMRNAYKNVGRKT